MSFVARMEVDPSAQSCLPNAGEFNLHSNLATRSMAESNNLTLGRIESFRSEKKTISEARREFSVLKHRYPFFGYVPCRAGNTEFAMFQANDDLVAWEYLWFGPDSYETKIVSDWIQWSRTKNTVLDIGSYTGLMSILAAKVNRNTVVHAFEPMERTAERAKINFKSNVVAGRVTLHTKAASDTNSLSNINMYRDDNFLGTGNSINQKTGIKTVEIKQITCVKIDDYLPDLRPTIVKIDVEGHELACLNGMIETIKRTKPKILIEVWEDTRDEVLKILTDLGYVCEPYDKKPIRVMNFRCIPSGNNHHH